MSYDFSNPLTAFEELNAELIECENCGEFLSPDNFEPNDERCLECNQYMNGEIE